MCYLYPIVLGNMQLTSHNVYGNKVELEKIWTADEIRSGSKEEAILCLQEVHEDDLKTLLTSLHLDPRLKSYPLGIQENDDFIVSWLDDFIQLPVKKHRAGKLFMVNIIPKKFFDLVYSHEPRVQIFSSFNLPFLIEPLLERITGVDESFPAAMGLQIKDKAGKVFDLMNVHLTAFTTENNRRFTLGGICRRLREFTPPGKHLRAILAGDFNPFILRMFKGEASLEKSLASNGFQSPFRHKAPTFNKSPLKDRRLDLIALPTSGNLSFERYQVHEDTKGSDHKPVIAEINID